MDASAEGVPTADTTITATKKRKFVVAGLAYGPTSTHFLMRKFVGTLRNTGYEGDIVLGIAEQQEEKVIEYYKKRNVNAQVVKPTSDLPLAFIRFYEYKKWIEPYADDDLVLLSDTADTFFQSDPFLFPEVQAMGSPGNEVDLMLFAEYLVKIGTQSHNSGTVRSHPIIFH